MTISDKTTDVLARQMCLHIATVVSLTGFDEADAKMMQRMMKEVDPYLQDVPQGFQRVADAAGAYAQARGANKRNAAEARLSHEVKRFFRIRLGNLDLEWRDVTGVTRDG